MEGIVPRSMLVLGPLFGNCSVHERNMHGGKKERGIAGGVWSQEILSINAKMLIVYKSFLGVFLITGWYGFGEFGTLTPVNA